MLADLLNADNYLVINLSAAHALGVDATIYLTELLSRYKKARTEGTLLEGDYFGLDREALQDKTTLSIGIQLKLDEKLGKLGIVAESPTNSNTLKMDIPLLYSIISCETPEAIIGISKQMKIKNPKESKLSQRKIIAERLKNRIQCPNEALKDALKDWIDAIYGNPTGYLSAKAVDLFQKDLNDYAKEDLELALRIVNIATIQGYKACQWAINTYEKDQSFKRSNEIRKPRITPQHVATKEDLGKDVF